MGFVVSTHVLRNISCEFVVDTSGKIEDSFDMGLIALHVFPSFVDAMEKGVP